MIDKVQRIRNEIKRLKNQYMSFADDFYSLGMEDKREHYAVLASVMEAILNFIDTMQEEPVSNNYSALLPCIYNRTLEERVKYCKYCSAACKGRVKEPVSEDLKNAANNALEGLLDKYDLIETGSCLEMFKLGAKWKKEEMMANAINTEASFTMSVPSICISLPLGVSIGDKVKVIVIKED